LLISANKFGKLKYKKYQSRILNYLKLLSFYLIFLFYLLQLQTFAITPLQTSSSMFASANKMLFSMYSEKALWNVVTCHTDITIF